MSFIKSLFQACSPYFSETLKTAGGICDSTQWKQREIRVASGDKCKMTIARYGKSYLGFQAPISRSVTALFPSVLSSLRCLREAAGGGAGGSSRRTCRMRWTHKAVAVRVSGDSCDRLRNPCGRSSTTFRVTGRLRERSLLANITESSNIGSSEQACKNKQMP